MRGFTVQIPTLSIAFMCVSALLAIGAPIALIVVFRKRFRIQALPVAFGAAAFIIFALILEALVHQIALSPDAYGNNAIAQSPVLFMLYGGFMAGIFEETGRFVSFKLLKKRCCGVKTGLAYGVGHGGVEAVLLVGVSMISSIILCVTINSIGSEQFIASAGAGVSPGVLEAQIASLAAAPPAQFLLGGIERLFAIAIQVSLSVFVYYAAYDNRRWYLYPLAILMHAVVDFIPALNQTGALGGENLMVIEGFVFACAALLVFLAVRLHRLMSREEAKTDITS